MRHYIWNYLIVALRMNENNKCLATIRIIYWKNIIK